MTNEADRKELEQWLKEANHLVYTKLNHVSRSGMSRNIDLILMIDNKPRYISARVADILDYSLANDGSIKVGGCGMDMGFHVVYSLSCALYCTKKYDHDKAYKLKQEWL